jgi:LppX_LprAFG lipoprotein
MRKKYTLPGLLLMVVMVLFVSACGGSSLTAGQLLSNSTNAMKQIKSLHFNMTATTNIAISGLPSSSSTSAIPNNTNITVNASGDEVMPDQASIKLSTSGAGKFALAEIMKGNQLYLQNAQGQWYVMDKSKLSGSSSSISSLLSKSNLSDFNKLLDLVQKNVQVADHGDQTLNGATLRHITITLDKNGLMQLIQSTSQFKSLPGTSQQSVNSMFNSVSKFSASLDFWFDESTSYIHRFEIKLNTTLDMSKFTTPTTGSTSSTPSGFSLKADIVVDLSKFNDSSIKITAPANAIPTDNPGVILGGA